LEVLEGGFDLVVIEHATGVETHGTQADMPVRQFVVFETKTAQAQRTEGGDRRLTTSAIALLRHRHKHQRTSFRIKKNPLPS
jgi:hypothetical protein